MDETGDLYRHIVSVEIGDEHELLTVLRRNSREARIAPEQLPAHTRSPTSDPTAVEQ